MTMLNRPLQLRFKADWGQANLTRLCGWLASQVQARTPPGTRSVIHTGTGMGDNVRAVSLDEVDVSVATPGSLIRAAYDGKGPFAGEPHTMLRALGCVPHDDALLFAIRADLGIESFEDLRRRRPAIRLSMGRDDGINFMGLGAVGVLRASGISVKDIVAWGGEIISRDHPADCLADVAEGRVDGVLQEAIMTPWWSRLADKVDLNFLSLEQDAEQRLFSDLSVGSVTVPTGYLRGLRKPVRAADFGGWVVIAREDMPDDVAELLASILVETASIFEGQYTHHDNARTSSLAYPITPQRLIQVPLPLHPGAERYYATIPGLELGAVPAAPASVH